jgi:chromosome segregation ATPase
MTTINLKRKADEIQDNSMLVFKNSVHVVSAVLERNVTLVKEKEAYLSKISLYESNSHELNEKYAEQLSLIRHREEELRTIRKMNASRDVEMESYRSELSLIKANNSNYKEELCANKQLISHLRATNTSLVNKINDKQTVDQTVSNKVDTDIPRGEQNLLQVLTKLSVEILSMKEIALLDEKTHDEYLKNITLLTEAQDRIRTLTREEEDMKVKFLKTEKLLSSCNDHLNIITSSYHLLKKEHSETRELYNAIKNSLASEPGSCGSSVFHSAQGSANDAIRRLLVNKISQLEKIKELV